jgi:hypothetical protein
MALGGAKHRQLAPTLASLWQRNGNHNGGNCAYLVEATLPDEAHTLGGAPSTVWTMVLLTAVASSSDDESHESNAAGGTPMSKKSLRLELEYLASNKTTTRLPESIFVQFKPAVEPEPAPIGWSLEMFNDSSITLDPMDVMPSPHGSGGAPHTRCVSGVRWESSAGGPSMRLSSKDVPCICTGTPTPFPTPRNEAPKMADGVSYNIYK